MFIRHSVYGVDLISTDQMAFYYGALLPELSSLLIPIYNCVKYNSQG